MWGIGWGMPYQPYYGGGYGGFRGGGGGVNGATAGTRGGRAASYRNATWRSSGSSQVPPQGSPAQPGTYKNQSLVVNKDGSTTSTTTPSTSTSKEVDINGIVFIKQGNKLVRKEGPSESTSTPKKATHGGTKYVRTKNGNLVAADLVKKRKDQLDAKLLAAKKERLDRLVGIVSSNQQARNFNSPSKRSRPKLNKLCRFFQKTGQCTNGLRCPYIHDSNKVAICQQFLRNKCPMSASTCPLSHQPNAHRSPHCVHFPNCKNGADCPYAHVHVARDAPLCSEFAEYGWCEAGEKCGKRHAYECPRFAESGVCTKKGCKLPHILRRRNDPSTLPSAPPVTTTSSSEQQNDQHTHFSTAQTDTDDESEEDDEEEEPVGISERFQKKRKASLTGNDDFVGFESSGSSSSSDQEDDEEDDIDSEDAISHQEQDSHRPSESESGSDGEEEQVAGMLVAAR